jgi:hypothetical protein
LAANKQQDEMNSPTTASSLLGLGQPALSYSFFFFSFSHFYSWPTITSTQDTQQRRQKHNVLFDISFQQRPSRAALENVKRDAGWRMNVQMKKEVTYHIHVGRERSIESHHTILTGPQKPYRHIKLD